jgi:hypothetical protein
MGLLRILVKLAGILLVLFGIVFLAVGVYGVAGGTGITFTINERLVTAQEGGQTFSVIGIIMLLVGIALNYFGFRKME